ncbi:MAG: ATPase, T2SS/T4P/T4SS family [Pirellulaceae bacterium]
MDRSIIYQKSLAHFLAPIQPMLQDPAVSEIMINGCQEIYSERYVEVQDSHGEVRRISKLVKADGVVFEDDEAVMSAIRNIAEYSGRIISSDQFEMNARLPGGERVHVIFPPSSRVGPCVTIRKFREDKFDLATLIQWDSISAEAAAFLELAVTLHKNIVISGGTGTGKTSFLNAVSGAIQEDERVVVIEDSSELKLQQQHVIYLETKGLGENDERPVTIRDLFVASLRMRPDRIVVEVLRASKRGDSVNAVRPF